MHKNKLYLNSKKGQSAMEYLMTYGWSILIIAIVLVSLFELGIFGNNSLSGNGACISQSGYLCTKVTLATNGILSATIGSAYGTITLTGIACTNNSAQPTSFNTITSTQINNGETISMSFSCPLTNNALGSSFNGNLWIEYTSGTVSDQITKVGAVSLKATIPGTSIVGSGTQQIYYAPITLSNDQSNSVPADFQQMIYFNPTSYSSNEMANLSNIEFTASAPIGTSGNVPLYSWMESNAFSTSTNTVIWVNLGSNTMGVAGSGSNTLTIYMNFLNSNTPVTSGYTGYAPQLWCASGCFQTSYAQYDNGVNVFNFYDNFAGTSLDTTKWNSEGVFTVNNGISFAITGTQNDVYTINVFSSPVIGEAYGELNTPLTSSQVGSIMGGEGFSSGSVGGNPAVTNGWAQSNINDFGLTIWNSAVYFYADNPSTTQNIYTIFGTEWLSSTDTITTINYIQSASSTALISPSTLDLVIGFQSNNFISNKYYWVRTRVYPPNGIMPGISMGSVI